jgi:hypothetical protein
MSTRRGGLKGNLFRVVTLPYQVLVLPMGVVEHWIPSAITVPCDPGHGDGPTYFPLEEAGDQQGSWPPALGVEMVGGRAFHAEHGWLQKIGEA